jgi:hypothetical protein
MKTVKFKVTCETGFVTATHEATMELEFEDDATQEEINEEIESFTREWALEKIDYYYEILGEE